MKKLTALALALMLLICAACAEGTEAPALYQAELTLTPSYEGSYHYIEGLLGLALYMPEDWTEYGAIEGFDYCYGNDRWAMLTTVTSVDIDTLYSYYVTDDNFTDFSLLTINGLPWLVFSSTDDKMLAAVMSYDTVSCLLIVFECAEEMNGDSLPIEMISTIAQVDMSGE